MEITKEQITQLFKNNEEGNDQLISADLKSWFPEAFIELKVGKWYWIDRRKKDDVKALVVFQGQGVETFGFTHGGIWTDDYGSESSFCTPEYKYTKATHEEVQTALINEAIRRGYKNNNHDCLYLPNFTHKNTDELFYLNKDTMNLHIGKNSVSNVIFKDGEWAELIETITLKKAEKLLNKRIV
jgi:hypothetical protein